MEPNQAHLSPLIALAVGPLDQEPEFLTYNGLEVDRVSGVAFGLGLGLGLGFGFGLGLGSVALGANPDGDAGPVPWRAQHLQ